MRTRHPGVRTAVAVLVATALGTAACSGGNEVADVTVVAPTTPTLDDSTDTAADTAASATTAVPAGSDVADPTTTGPASSATGTPASIAAPSTSDADGLTGPTFSDALGVRVDTAPGVRTRGDTRRLLDAGLYVHLAWEADPDDPSVFTVQPDDVPILEAYANAATAYYRSATTTRTTDHPDFDLYFLDSGAKYEESLRQARQGDFVLDLGTGVVLRPYVVDLASDSATVYDCYLQDEEYVVSGTSRPADELEQQGQVATLVRVNERWIVDTAAEFTQACP